MEKAAFPDPGGGLRDQSRSSDAEAPPDTGLTAESLGDTRERTGSRPWQQVLRAEGGVPAVHDVLLCRSAVHGTATTLQRPRI